MSKHADQQRRRKHAKAEAAGRTMRYNTTGRTAEEKAAQKLEYKHQQRVRAAEREGRVLVRRHRNRPPLPQAHVADYIRYKDQTRLHDAHVWRFVRVMKSRANYAARYKANPQAEIDRQKRRKQALPESYVVQNLTIMGIAKQEVTAEMISIKREQIALRRLSLEIKKAAKQANKEKI